MFILSKRNYLVRRDDGSPFVIKKDYIGEIPEDVARSHLVQRAIRGGMIAVPQGMTDKALEKADAQAAEKATGKDIRLDASGRKGEQGNRSDNAGSQADDAEKGTGGAADAEGKEVRKRKQG